MDAGFLRVRITGRPALVAKKWGPEVPFGRLMGSRDIRSHTDCGCCTESDGFRLQFIEQTVPYINNSPAKLIH